MKLKRMKHIRGGEAPAPTVMKPWDNMDIVEPLTVVLKRVMYHFTPNNPYLSLSKGYDVVEYKLFYDDPNKEYDELVSDTVEYLLKFKPKFLARFTLLSHETNRYVIVYSEPWIPPIWREVVAQHLDNIEKQLQGAGIMTFTETPREYLVKRVLAQYISTLHTRQNAGRIKLYIPAPREVLEEIGEEKLGIPLPLVIAYLTITSREYPKTITPILLDDDIEDASITPFYDWSEGRVKNRNIYVVLSGYGVLIKTNILFPAKADDYGVMNEEYKELLTWLRTDITVNRQIIITSRGERRFTIKDINVSGVVNAPYIHIRRLSSQKMGTLVDFYDKESKFYITDNPYMYAYLLVMKRLPKLFMIVGASGVGKTTFLSRWIASGSAEERVVIIEDVEEIVLGDPLLVDKIIIKPPAVTYKTAFAHVKTTRPPLVVIGELAYKEQFDIAIHVLGAGSSFATTFHSHTPEDVVARLTTFYPLSSLVYIFRLVPVSLFLSKWISGAKLYRRVTSLVEFYWDDEKGKATYNKVFEGNIKTGDVEPKTAKDVFERSIVLQSLTKPEVMGLEEYEVVELLEKYALLIDTASKEKLTAKEFIKLHTLIYGEITETSLSEFREKLTGLIHELRGGRDVKTVEYSPN